jgi:hypothetical protein
VPSPRTFITRVLGALLGGSRVPPRKETPEARDVELDFYLRSLDRYRVYVSDDEAKPVKWLRVTGFEGGVIQARNGESLGRASVRRYAVTYPSGVLVTVKPAHLSPLPSGAHFQPTDAPTSEVLRDSDLDTGRAYVRIDFAASGPKPHDPNHFTMTFSNISHRRVRVLRFGGYQKEGDVYRVSTFTEALFNSDDFINWYAAPADGWIAPGQSVSDPTSYGGGLWAYHCETEDHLTFIASGSPAS